MTNKIEEMARNIADVVSGAVRNAHYSREHLAAVAHKAAYLIAYRHLSVLEAETRGTEVEVDLKELSKLYDERRKAERYAELKAAANGTFAKRDKAIREFEAHEARQKNE
jgi:hypothetical protein